MRPGQQPLTTLIRALAELSEGALTGAPAPQLLVIDQAEELFTQTERPDTRQAFVQQLWRLAKAPHLQISIIMTLRVDYIGRCGKLFLDPLDARAQRRTSARD